MMVVTVTDVAGRYFRAVARGSNEMIHGAR